MGPSGTGKSHLAQALGQCAIRQGVDTVFTTCAQLTATLNAARANGGYERRLAAFARMPLLIIDDNHGNLSYYWTYSIMQSNWWETLVQQLLVYIWVWNQLKLVV